MNLGGVQKFTNFPCTSCSDFASYESGDQNFRSPDLVRTMTILTIAAVVIVIAWFAFTTLFWTSFKEDERVHPIYRSTMAQPEIEPKPASCPKTGGSPVLRINAACAPSHGTVKQS